MNDILNEDRDVDVGLIPDKPESEEYSESYLDSETSTSPEEESIEEQEPPEEEEGEESDLEEDEEEDDFITPDSL